MLAALIILAVSLASTRRLSLVPGKLQNLMEMTIGGLEDFFTGVIGPGAERHIPLLITFFLYILTMNLFGLTGVLIPPTSSLNMTIALALLAIVYVQIQGIRANGLGGYLRHFAGEPIWLAPLMFPLHVISEVAKPLSLSFRLFGNIFGEEIVMVQLALLGPLVLFGSHALPIQFPLLILGLLKCIIQAVVFTTLVAVYLVIMTEHAESHETEGHEPSAAHAPPAETAAAH